MVKELYIHFYKKGRKEYFYVIRLQRDVIDVWRSSFTSWKRLNWLVGFVLQVIVARVVISYGKVEVYLQWEYKIQVKAITNIN